MSGIVGVRRQRVDEEDYGLDRPLRDHGRDLSVASLGPESTFWQRNPTFSTSRSPVVAVATRSNPASRPRTTRRSEDRRQARLFPRW
jgi:hypothetical protein